MNHVIGCATCGRQLHTRNPRPRVTFCPPCGRDRDKRVRRREELARDRSATAASLNRRSDGYA